MAVSPTKQPKPKGLTSEESRKRKLLALTLPDHFEYAPDRIANQCHSCEGFGCDKNVTYRYIECTRCKGIGYFNIDPTLPTICPPGTQERMVIARARMRVELPTDNPLDATLEDFDAENTEFLPVERLLCGRSKDLYGRNTGRPGDSWKRKSDEDDDDELDKLGQKRWGI